MCRSNSSMPAAWRASIFGRAASTTLEKCPRPAIESRTKRGEPIARAHGSGTRTKGIVDDTRIPFGAWSNHHWLSSNGKNFGPFSYKCCGINHIYIYRSINIDSLLRLKPILIIHDQLVHCSNFTSSHNPHNQFIVHCFKKSIKKIQFNIRKIKIFVLGSH